MLCIACLVACSHPQTVSVPVRFTPESIGSTPPRRDSEAVRAARAKLAAFDYQKSDIVSIQRQEISSVANVVTEEITMIINDPLRRIGNFEQKFLFYRHPLAERRPTVLVFTLFGEEVLVDKLAAKFFCRKGFNALIVIPPELLADTERKLALLNDVLIRYTISARMGIDMLEGFPETDPDRFFAYGMSMGGIRSSLFFGVEPRVRRAGVIAAGGDIPGMISDTDYDTLQDARNARMAAEKIPDLASVRTHLDNALTVDPLDFARLREPEDITFVISSNDQYVRNTFQEKLFDAFSKPREGRFPGAIYSNTGHLTTGGRFYQWANRFAKFFHAC